MEDSETHAALALPGSATACEEGSLAPDMRNLVPNRGQTTASHQTTASLSDYRSCPYSQAPPAWTCLPARALLSHRRPRDREQRRAAADKGRRRLGSARRLRPCPAATEFWFTFTPLGQPGPAVLARSCALGAALLTGLAQTRCCAAAARCEQRAAERAAVSLRRQVKGPARRAVTQATGQAVCSDSAPGGPGWLRCHG